jgi:hypothetical protein
VTALPAAAGTELHEGELVAAVADRPVILLQADLPLYRDLGPGDSGPDVVALQRSLARLGHRIRAGEAGILGPSTQAAVSAVWRAAGYPPLAAAPSPDDPAGTAVRVARSEVLTVAHPPALVLRVDVRLGGSVDPTQPVLVVADGGLVVRAVLDGPQAALVRPGMSGVLAGAAVTVLRVEPPADPTASGGATAVLGPASSVPLDPSLAGSNQPLAIDLAPPTPEPVLAIPISAIRSDGDTSYVVVAGHGGSRRAEVVVGSIVGGWVEVRSGDVGAGDRVVVRAP